MDTIEKQISYSNSTSYSTLNELTAKTKNVWVVFHGIGYLSRYFLKYFDLLDKEENYVIAPQAPSKYYLNNAYKHVGASWLTKEDTSNEMENILNYLDAIFIRENIPEHCKLVVFGFSQGVSIAMRWVAKRKIQCSQLILYAGGIPAELTRKDLAFLSDKTEVKIIVGDQDEYLTEARMAVEKEKINVLFNKRAALIRFEGKHEVKKQLIVDMV